MRLMDCFFKPYQPTDVKLEFKDDEMADLESMLEAMMLFSLTWSIGATTTAEGRNKFDSKLKELMGKENRFKYPPNETCYGVMFNTVTKDWVKWEEIN
jgi:hypothetical protein